MSERTCICGAKFPDKGRAFDGRRAYRCTACNHTWTEGMQGRRKTYSKQRVTFQFHDTGAKP